MIFFALLLTIKLSFGKMPTLLKSGKVAQLVRALVS